MRLQVFLSHNGVCSRRKALELIFQGHVAVNGRIMTEPSADVDPGRDKISVNGREIETKAYTYILLNKPSGYVTTKEDRFAAQTVFDLLPPVMRHLAPVGRLDKDTEGLLLLTNDGDLAYQLTHPKFQIKKVYFVRIEGKLDLEKKRKLEQGILLDDQKTAPAGVEQIKYGKNQTEFYLTIHEGRKRQIRRMLAKIGHAVVYLKRVAQGPLQLGNLKSGQWRLLNERELEGLRNRR